MENDIDFKRAMQDVKPIKKDKIAPSYHRITAPPAVTSPIHNAKVEIAIRNERNASDLFFLRVGQQKKVLSSLRKGQFDAFDAQIDLHGYRHNQAERALNTFLTECRQDEAIYALIIHGKGLRSDNRPVIKDLSESILIGYPYTVAYCSARVVDGGSGALYVQFAYPHTDTGLDSDTR